MLLTKIKTVSSAAVAVMVMVGTGMVWYSNSALADDPTTPPAVVIKADAKKTDDKPLTKMQGLWKDLASHDDVRQTKAVLAMAAVPKETMTFLQTELRPVKFDRAKALKWIADLGSDKEEIYQLAMKELDYIAPLIQEDLDDAIENAPNDNARQRAMTIMMDMPEALMPAPGGVGRVVVGGAAALPALPAVPAPAPAPPAPAPVFPPLPGGAVIQIAGGPGMDEGVYRLSWKRAVRAITILEHLGTPDAVATLKKIAEGETDAAPTKAAKEALKRLEKSSE